LDKVQWVKESKKMTLAVVSLIVGLALAFGVELRVLQPLGVASSDLLDGIVTGLIVSAGSEGFNSIMKFLGYAKEQKKADAAEKKEDVQPAALAKLEQAV
jgi:hypothetical protein